jgi:hypothetical protein
MPYILQSPIIVTCWWTYKSSASYRNLLRKIFPRHSLNEKGMSNIPMDPIWKWILGGNDKALEHPSAMDLEFGWGGHREWGILYTMISPDPLGIWNWKDSMEGDMCGMWIQRVFGNVCPNAIALESGPGKFEWAIVFYWEWTAIRRTVKIELLWWRDGVACLGLRWRVWPSTHPWRGDIPGYRCSHGNSNCKGWIGFFHDINVHAH